MRIEKKKGEFEIDVKRFVVPFVAVAVCPNCGKEVRRNLSGDGPDSWPLDYPTTGNFELDLYCGDGCEHEWAETVRLSIVLEPVSSLVELEKEKPCLCCAALVRLQDSDQKRALLEEGIADEAAATARERIANLEAEVRTWEARAAEHKSACDAALVRLQESDLRRALVEEMHDVEHCHDEDCEAAWIRSSFGKRTTDTSGFTGSTVPRQRE